MRRRPLILAALLGTAARATAQSAVHEVHAGGGSIEVQFDDGFEPQTIAAAMVWVQRAADTVSAFLGRLPLARFELVLQATPGHGVGGGVAFAEPQPYVRVRLGLQTRHEEFADDWVLVHEMLHLAVPRVPRPQRWLHEGIATYAEGAARVLAGTISAAHWWGGLARGMPHGLPQPGDRGLDHTPTWGRTYWGGALFCLLADVQMRCDGDVHRGLRQALQGVMSAGGSYAESWPAQRVLATADNAVGQHVLMPMYARMGDQPLPVDLAALWRSLGVAGQGAAPARLAVDAPLADVRRAIAA